MNAVEFTAELSEAGVLRIPAHVAALLPKTGRARVILLTDTSAEEAEWQRVAYEQFLREDPPQDAIYDSCR